MSVLLDIIEGNKSAPSTPGINQELMELVERHGDILDPRYAAVVAVTLIPLLLVVEAAHEGKRFAGTSKAEQVQSWRAVYRAIAAEVAKIP